MWCWTLTTLPPTIPFCPFLSLISRLKASIVLMMLYHFICGKPHRLMPASLFNVLGLLTLTKGLIRNSWKPFLWSEDLFSLYSPFSSLFNSSTPLTLKWSLPPLILNAKKLEISPFLHTSSSLSMIFFTKQDLGPNGSKQKQEER